MTGTSKPSSASCRRACSSVYYAIFHCLAKDCADLLVGTAGAARSDEAWKQAYRALDHKPARSKCEQSDMMKKFPLEIQGFAERFVTMQFKRHDADYNPDARYSKSEIVHDIALAQEAIHDYNSVRAKHRRAFCVYILLNLRDNKPAPKKLSKASPPSKEAAGT